MCCTRLFFFFFQAEDGIRDLTVTGVQTCALPIYQRRRRYLPVEPFRVARGLYQLPLPGLSRLRIQPTHLLPTGMKITSYKHHVKAPSFPSVFGPQPKDLLG